MPEDVKPTTPAQDTPPAEVKETTPAVEAKPETKDPVLTPPPETKQTQETTKEPKEEPKKVAPEKYDLKVSEDSVLEPGLVEKIAAHAKQQGLSQEEAQALVTEREQAIATYVEERSQQWLKEVENDKEIGGTALKQNVELAARVVDRFGDPELKAELNKTGFGNHPKLVRLLTRIGKAMQEDQLVQPGAVPAAGRSRESLYYPNHKEN